MGRQPNGVGSLLSLNGPGAEHCVTWLKIHPTLIPCTESVFLSRKERVEECNYLFYNPEVAIIFYAYSPLDTN